MAKLSAPKLDVTVLDADGVTREYTVQTDNRDSVRWDMTRTRMRWAGAQEAPFIWLTFMAWSALERGGDTKLTIDQFMDVCLAVSLTSEDEEDNLVGGTPPVHVPA